MKKERGMSGELKGLCSLFAAILPPLPCPGPPGPHSRGERSPSGSRNSWARVSSRQFREPRPRALRDASGNSRCHSKHGKRARPVTWGSPVAGGKSLESGHGTGKITRDWRGWRFMPRSALYYRMLFGFSRDREKEFAT